MNYPYIPPASLKALVGRRRNHEEGEISAALVTWFGFASKGLGCPDPRVLVKITNEGSGSGHKNMIRGKILKGQGLRAGFPDFFLFCPRGSFCGLALELKTQKGVVSAEQKEMLTLLGGQGYYTAIAFGLNAAMEEITKYLKLKPVPGVWGA